MSKRIFILSTLSADQLYTTWVAGGADLPKIAKQVFVAGGANVANRKLVTPQGVVTEVDEDDLAALETNEVFQLHKTNGYITVSKTKPGDADAAAASQEQRSPDAPLVEGDFAPGKAPVSGSATATADTAQAQRAVAPNSRRA